MITYESICEKFGCDFVEFFNDKERKKARAAAVKTEDDSVESPYSVLSLEEKNWLIDNHYV